MELDHEFTVPVPVDQAWSVLLDVERVALCMPGATLDSVEGDEFAGRLKVKLGAMTITYKGTARIVTADEPSRTVTIEAAGKESRGAGTASATVQSQLHDEGDTTRVTVHTKFNVTGRPAQFSRGILAEVGGKLVSRFAKNLADQLETDNTQSTTAVESAAPVETPDPVETAATPASATPVQSTVTSESATTGQSVTSGSAATGESAASRAAAPGESAREAAASAAAAGSVTPAAPQRAVSTPAHRRADNDAIDLLEFAGPSVAKRAAPVIGALAALLALRYLFRRRRGRHHR